MVRKLLLFFISLFYFVTSASGGGNLCARTTKNVSYINFKEIAVNNPAVSTYNVGKFISYNIAYQQFNLAPNDTIPVVINEFLVGSSVKNVNIGNEPNMSTRVDEFIEIVNNTSSTVNISGWKLSDDGGHTVKYTFPAGTILKKSRAVVVVGGEKPLNRLGGATVLTVPRFNLTNSGGQLTLLDDAGNIVQRISYSGDVNGASLTRDPDITGSFVRHSVAVGSKVLPYSPGTKINGIAFRGTYVLKIRGDRGWRMLATPTKSTSFRELFSELGTGRTPGSEIPTEAKFYKWDAKKASFMPVKNLGDNLIGGKGYVFYIYEDKNRNAGGIQGGSPKIIEFGNAGYRAPVKIAVASSDVNGNGTIDDNEGWNLLGNPFGAYLSVAAVKNALKSVNSNLNANIYVWNHATGSGNGGYALLSDGDFIAPFQAFWVRYTVAGVDGMVIFNKNNLAASRNGKFYSKFSGRTIGFKLYLGDQKQFDTYSVVFNERGLLGEDKLDGYKLFSMNNNSINLFSTLGGGVKLAKNVLPGVSGLERKIRIPLKYQLPHEGEYTFRWGELKKLAPTLEIYLIDNKTGIKINLRMRQQFTFSYRGEDAQNVTVTEEFPVINNTKNIPGGPRFELLITSSEIDNNAENAIQKPVTLSPNYPNPFRSQTEMTFTLKEKSEVTITIWNIVGQRVATIMEDEMKSAGSHTYYWNAAASLPSGIYICKLEAAGTVLIRKMTLIR